MPSGKETALTSRKHRAESLPMFFRLGNGTYVGREEPRSVVSISRAAEGIDYMPMGGYIEIALSELDDLIAALEACRGH